ncbi:helix-turn-helix domain-containing protein [Flavobacterium faecale]|uniref:helix-turn-helix domain-containing protein n=1 Tax=Flavobacterium faecale TaxID=1355330 RepID=UPI003AAD0741
MKENIIYTILNILAVFNIVVLCTFLLIRKNNSYPNYLLAVIFAIPGLYFFDNILINTGLIHSAPYFFFFVQMIANLFPITVYKYLHILIGNTKKIKSYLVIASAVTILFSVVLLLDFCLLSSTEQTNYINHLSTDEYPKIMDMYNVVFYICQMIYLVELFIDIKKYRIAVKNNLSATESVKLLFARQFILLMAILNFLLVVFYILLPANIVDYGVLPVVMTVIYLFVITFSIKNNAIFSHESFNALVAENKRITEYTSCKSTNWIQDGRWDSTITVLEELIKTDKVFKDNKLNLTTLSDMVEEQPYIVSQILNQHFKKSFFDFINEARVDEAIILLKTFDSKVDTIENIASEVGFNSRASFYRSFKKVTGKNPTDFVLLS